MSFFYFITVRLFLLLLINYSWHAVRQSKHDRKQKENKDKSYTQEVLRQSCLKSVDTFNEVYIPLTVNIASHL